MLNDFERSLRAFAAAASTRFTKVEVVKQSLDELVAALAQEGEVVPIDRNDRARIAGRVPRIVVDNTTLPELR